MKRKARGAPVDLVALDRNIRHNPVVKAMARRALETEKVRLQILAASMADWEHCPVFLGDVAEILGTAIKSIEGWDDEQNLGDALVDAIEAVSDMATSGHVWRTKYSELIHEALWAAVGICNCMPVDQKTKAWLWTRSVMAQQQQETTC